MSAAAAAVCSPSAYDDQLLEDHLRVAVADSSAIMAPEKITASFGDITISSDFDSGNLAKVEECRSTEGIDIREFDLWTSPDCAGTGFENGNRSWFYFSVSTPPNYIGKALKFNIHNLNRQSKLYQQGLTPIMKTVPGRGMWERLRTRADYEVVDGAGMKLTFYINFTDSRKLTTYLAFCYPFSYSESQRRLAKLDAQFKMSPTINSPDQIYYQRELLCYSLERRRVDLITVTSLEGKCEEKEERLPHLFPDENTERCHVFVKKKVVFISSRVHPGETPSSHVFNGLLQFLLRPKDARAIAARKHFVFKLIPMLNPDGVYRGHYRTDTRGANLNRHYLKPDIERHPSIYAARLLILHHHRKKNNGQSFTAKKKLTHSRHITPTTSTKLTGMFESFSLPSTPGRRENSSGKAANGPGCILGRLPSSSAPTLSMLNDDSTRIVPCDPINATKKSGLALYVDLHAHASKRGVFMYGNFFAQIPDQAENMLFPKLMSLNSPHLDFEHCVFSERNMYIADKRDGTSKEGSGRVAMHKATGIIPSYTLECNYNSGRQCNGISGATTDGGNASPSQTPSPMTHRYTISDFEQVGRALATSVLDLFQLNPWSRLPTTSYGCLVGVRQSLARKLQISRAAKMGQTASVDEAISRSGEQSGASSPDKLIPLKRSSEALSEPRSARFSGDLSHLSGPRHQKTVQIKPRNISLSKIRKERCYELKPTLASIKLPGGGGGSIVATDPSSTTDSLSHSHMSTYLSGSKYTRGTTPFGRNAQMLQDSRKKKQKAVEARSTVGTTHPSSKDSLFYYKKSLVGASKKERLKSSTTMSLTSRQIKPPLVTSRPGKYVHYYL